MNLTLIPISQLSASALDRLAALHMSSMPTLLAELGLPVVRSYYEVCHRDPGVVGMCAFALPQKGEAGEEKGELLGWAVGSPYPDEINARTRRPLTWFVGQMLQLARSRPGVLWQLAASVLSASARMEPDALELTYIGVAASARGQGLGKALLAAFVEAGRTAGYRRVVLSVETDNPGALALYNKTGFQITRTFTEGHFERHRMELVF